MKHEIKMLLLAILVVASFVAAAIAISYRSYGLLILFLFLGFGMMGYGLRLKRLYQQDAN
ncbi:DUF5325 family protein [Alkalibacillus aidingensis]|uniref:DUF5325 family protein n=1 Tax=Alkalibacillus aidingensis TaxID=2747607 RepID=UPI0016604C73|nr:DUF5325 family protein [Alkalibacillus aidingensis]